MIAYNTNPLLSPHWAAANVFFGFVLFFWIITPAIYYTNTWFTAYLPFCTAEVYDRFGSLYNATNVMTGEDFDKAKYLEYSPPYLPATFAFVCISPEPGHMSVPQLKNNAGFANHARQVYGLSFASITSVLSHVYFFHWEDIVRALKGSTKLDHHARLMRTYKKVPLWWWGCIILVVFALAVVLTEVFHTGLPVYGIVLAFVIPAIYMVPCGMIQGVTNVRVFPFPTCRVL